MTTLEQLEERIRKLERASNVLGEHIKTQPGRTTLPFDGAGSGIDADLLDGQEAAAFAPAGQGVTNGNNHDHNGGDGAQIDHGGLAGLADDDHSQYLKADGTRAVTGDLRVSSGLVVGNGGANDPGNGEVWLQEQSTLPGGTTSILKSVNYKGLPIAVDPSGNRYIGATPDMLGAYLLFLQLRGFWYGHFQIQNAAYAWLDRIGNKNLTPTGTITPSVVRHSNMPPIGYLEAGAGSGNYLSVGTPTDFAPTNWISCFGWFYIPTTGTVIRPLATMGSTTIAWSMYIYNNVLQSLMYNTGGAASYSPGVSIAPDAWNFCGFSLYWASAGNYQLQCYANGTWSSNLSTDPGSGTRTPAGNFLVFSDGTNYSPGFRVSSLLMGLQAGSGTDAQGILLDYIYRTTKPFYGQ